jgi:enoyl-[acyl-carrier-protein] reductase (NADH)
MFKCHQAGSSNKNKKTIIEAQFIREEAEITRLNSKFNELSDEITKELCQKIHNSELMQEYRNKNIITIFSVTIPVSGPSFYSVTPETEELFNQIPNFVKLTLAGKEYMVPIYKSEVLLSMESYDGTPSASTHNSFKSR